MYRILIVIFITGIAFFLPYFPVFATGGTGEGSLLSDASSSSSVPKRARSSSLPSSSSASVLPGLQPPTLLRAPVLESVGSSSSAIPAVLPPLSLGTLLNQVLSPVTATLSALMGEMDNLGARLEKMEGRLEKLENVENGGLETKALNLPPKLIAKVAAAVENRKLTETDGESELFTSKELKDLQRYFYDYYDSKHLDIYNICLLFLSFNIAIMPLDLYEKNSFSYRLIFCLLENILPQSSGATDFQRAKGNILHYALAIFNRRMCNTLAELKWFFRGYLEFLDPHGSPFTLDEHLLLERYEELYFEKLLAQAFQEPDDPLLKYLALEACFYVGLRVRRYSASTIWDNEFIEKALQKEFGVYDEGRAKKSNEYIFEFLSAKIVRYFYCIIRSQKPSLKPHIKLFSTEISMPAIDSISSILQWRIVLTHGLLLYAWIDEALDRDNIYNPGNSDAKIKLKEISEFTRDNFTILPLLFEGTFKVDLMDLSALPKNDEMILRYLIIGNTFHAQGYYLQIPSLQEHISSLQNGEGAERNYLLFLSALFHYFFASMSKETEEEKRDFVERMNLFQKVFAEKFERWQGDGDKNSSDISGILAIYRVFYQISFHKAQYNFFRISEKEYKENEHENIQRLWKAMFSNIYEEQQNSYRASYSAAKGLEIYTNILIESLVTTALLSYDTMRGIPSIHNLIPMDLQIFRNLLEEYLVPTQDDALLCLLYLFYPNNILLSDVGFRSGLSLDYIRDCLKVALKKPQALEIHGYQQGLITRYIKSK